MDPLSGFALRPLQLLLDRGVRSSATARAIAVILEGQSLELQVLATPLVLRLAAVGGRVNLSAGGESAHGAPASAALAGTALSLARLLSGDPQKLIREGDVQLTGNTDVANQFRDLLHMARPDLEDAVSRLLGDPIAQQLGDFARNLSDWSRRAADTVGRSLGEYLTEERRTLPAQAEVEEFHRDVDQLADDVARAEARLARLKAQPGP